MPIFWDPFGGLLGSGAGSVQPPAPTQPPSPAQPPCPISGPPQENEPGSVYGIFSNVGGSGPLGGTIQTEGYCWQPASNTNVPDPNHFQFIASFNNVADAQAQYGPLCLCQAAASPEKPPAGPCAQPPACGPQVCPPDQAQQAQPAQDDAGAGGWVGGDNDCKPLDDFAAQAQGDTVSDLLVNAGILAKPAYMPLLLQGRNNAKGIPWVGGFFVFCFDAINALAVTPILALSSYLSAMAAATTCNPGPLAVYAIRRVFLTWSRRLLGAGTEKLEHQISHGENYFCPTGVPSIPECNQAYTTGDITFDQWRCWVRMNNLDEKSAHPVRLSGREQLAPFELGQGWLRKYLTDDQYLGALEQRGMLSLSDRQLAQKLTEFYPPVTDILHFIVRSLGDAQTVQRFGLLEEFDILYQGKLVEWGEAAGIKKETMEFYHAAHWVVPPIGMIFTMRQRLREENLPEGTDAGDWIVDDEDVNRALRENAYAPFWRPRLEAIAYNPISRRDLLQAYQRGIMDEEHFASRLRDLGYDQPNANLIAETYKARILDAIKKEQWTKLYEQSAVTHAQAVAQLQEQGYSLPLIETALAETDQLADAKTRIDCLKNFEREYALGGLSSGDAASLLLQAGLDNTQTQRLLVQWDCRKRSRPKSVPAATLCKWYSHGLISPEEIAIRLIRVGYSEDDSRLIVAECVASTADQRLRARYKALQEQQRELQRQQRTGAYVSKQQALARAAEIKALAKQLKARESALVAQEREQARQAAADARTAERQATAVRKAETAEERREAKLQVAVQALSLRAGIGSEAAASLLATALSTATAQSGIDPGTALEAIILSAHDRRSVDEASFQALVQKAIQAALTIESGAIASVPQPAPSNQPTPKTP